VAGLERGVELTHAVPVLGNLLGVDGLIGALDQRRKRTVDLVSQGFAPISACPAESAEPLKCLSRQLQGKLTCGKLSTERRSFSGG
jgi:hypothetical protein